MFPQFAVNYLGGVYLNIPTSALFAAHVVLQFGVDAPAVWMPKYLARCFFLHVEQVHFAAQLAVITFGGFFQHMKVGFELFFAGERHAVDALQHRAIAVAAPVSACDGHQFKAVTRHLTSVLKVRATAEVLPFAVPIHAQGFIAGNTLDQLDLIRFAAILVIFDRQIAVPYFCAHGFAFVDDFLHLLFDGRKVFWGEGFLAIEIIVPTAFDDRTDGHFGVRPDLLDCTRHDVRQIVADQFAGLILVLHSVQRD